MLHKEGLIKHHGVPFGKDVQEATLAIPRSSVKLGDVLRGVLKVCGIAMLFRLVLLSPRSGMPNGGQFWGSTRKPAGGPAPLPTDSVLIATLSLPQGKEMCSEMCSGRKPPLPSPVPTFGP